MSQQYKPRQLARNKPAAKRYRMIHHQEHTTMNTPAVAYCASEQLPTPWVHPSGRESWYARSTGTERWRGTLTDWHGNKIGTYIIKSRSDSRRYSGAEPTYYISATINGIQYYGRTGGPGMAAYLKAYKHQ